VRGKGKGGLSGVLRPKRVRADARALTGPNAKAFFDRSKPRVRAGQEWGGEIRGWGEKRCRRTGTIPFTKFSSCGKKWKRQGPRARRLDESGNRTAAERVDTFSMVTREGSGERGRKNGT